LLIRKSADGKIKKSLNIITKNDIIYIGKRKNRNFQKGKSADGKLENHLNITSDYDIIIIVKEGEKELWKKLGNQTKHN